MLEDYSGEFDPKISLDKFSKDTILGLTKMYAKFYSSLDGFWYLSIRERINDDEALACDAWVCGKQPRYELDRVTKLLKIPGKDVIALMKALQFIPWFSVYKYQMEVENKNHAVLTITECPPLTALEKEGKGREERLCRTVGSVLFEKCAQYFNPNIEVRYLKLPPRKSKDEICCQWDFRLR